MEPILGDRGLIIFEETRHLKKWHMNGHCGEMVEGVL